MVRPSGGASGYKINPYRIREPKYTSLGFYSIDNITYENMIAQVDAAVSEGYIAALLMHELTLGNFAGKTNYWLLNRMMEYIYQKGIPVYTYTDLFGVKV
jgi:hypothetical protein